MQMGNDEEKLHGVSLTQRSTPTGDASQISVKVNGQSPKFLHDDLLARQGYSPELKRNFSFWSLLGVAFGLTNSWLGIAGSMGESISSGGPFMVIYGILTAFVFVLPVGVTLGELISMYPNSGGQYYWTFQLAPKKNARFLAYTTGNLGWLGSVFTCASISLTAAQAFLASWQLTHPDFEVQAWQVVVCSVATTLFISLFNCWDKPLPYLTVAALIMSLTSFVIIIIVCLAVNHGHFESATFVFVEPLNVDKSMIGITFLVMLTAPTWALAGLDAATHMAEELPDPARTIPKAILSTICIGAFTAFVFSLSLFFCIRDLDKVMDAYLPLLEIIHQALNYNTAASVVVEMFAVLTALFCNISANTWQARNCWSFSRDNGIIGSRWWKQVNSKTHVPVNAHLFSNFLVILINLVYLGSSTAYNSIITASVEILYLSYVIPTICLMCKGRSKVTPGPFWWGKFGLCCNYLTCFWVAFCLIFFSLPYDLPATASNMNYVSAVYAGCFVYIIASWFLWGKRSFVRLEDRIFDDNDDESKPEIELQESC